MSQTCEEFVVHEDRVLSSIYSSRAGHGERTRCAFITNTSLEVMCAQYMLSAFVYKLATMIAPFTEMIDVVKMDGHSFTLTTGGLQEIVELLQTSGLTSINDAYRIVVSALFKAEKLPDVDPFDNLSNILEITSSANPKKKEDIKQKVLYLYESKIKSLVESGRVSEAATVYTKGPHTFGRLSPPETTVFLDALKICRRELAHSIAIRTHPKNERESGRTNSKSINVNESSLKFVVENGNVFDVCDFLEKGENPKEADDIEVTLRWTITHGFTEVLQILLLYGADATAALSLLAVELGLEGVVSALLKNGAKISTENQFNRTLLRLAAMEGHEKVVNLLLQNGAAVSTIDE